MDKIKTIAEARESLARIVELAAQNYEDALSLQDGIAVCARDLEDVVEAVQASRLWVTSQDKNGQH